MFETEEQATDAYVDQCQQRLTLWFALAFMAIYGLHLVGLYSMIPASIRLPLCGFVFCMGPGFALFSILSYSRNSRYPYLTLLVLSCSLGLTYNFIANVAIYVFQPSLAQAMEVYLLLACLLYLAVLAASGKQGRVPWDALRRIQWPAVVGCGAILILWSVVISNKTPAGLYVEELVILRKLFENSSISMTNIAFHADEYTTYFFVPFYQMLAMSAQFSGIDILDVQQGLWPFTAAVSLLCLAAITRQITRRWAAVAAIVCMGIIHGLFLPQPMSNALTVFAPFPDRYAFAAGVLVPLAMFHFLIHMAERKINIPAFIGLVYLIVEMTFIHARETLFFVGMMVVTGFVMLLNYRERKHDLVRVLWLLGVVGLVLLAYRQINLALQPDLGRFLSHLREDMVAQLQRGLDAHGVLTLLGVPQLHLDQYDTFPYQHHFPYWWFTPGLAFVPAALCLLPLYVMVVDRFALLVLPLAIVGFGFFSLPQGLHLVAGIIVGVPFIFDVFSVLFILLAVVFADTLALVSALLATPNEGSLRRVGLWGLALIAGVVTVELAVNRNNPEGFATGGVISEIALYGGALAGLLIRAGHLRRNDVGKDSRIGVQHSYENSCKGKHAWLVPGRKVLAALILARPRALVFTTVCVTGALMVQALWVTVWPHRAIGASERVKNHVGPEDMVAARYNQRDRQHLFHVAPDLSWRLPPAIISYIRREIPELQTWFGGHTMPVLIVSNQYAPVLSVAGSLNSGFFSNVPFVEKIQGEAAAKQFRVSSGVLQLGDFSRLLEVSRDIREPLELLWEYGVQWIMTRPVEGEAIDRVLANDPQARAALEFRFESEDYRIYRLRPHEGEPPLHDRL